ncbi:MAG: hypothetical protein A3F18_03590 [Legionellales bacterium RIFCSPHIGHO2_12_FULL_37_14]|nr:MAG: hypothetical protein A3F18_03590 [Legionellales bacterium RIFCSPHIGHO2_12_FULL_37_14]
MKIAIIGAGVIGVSTAYYLYKDHQVTIFERKLGAALETSYANAGLLTPSLCEPWNSPGILWQLVKSFGRKSQPFSIKPHQLLPFLTFGMQFISYATPKYFYQNFAHNIDLAKLSAQLMQELHQEIPLNFSYHQKGTLQLFRKGHDKAAIHKFLALACKMHINCKYLTPLAMVEKEPALLPIQNLLYGGIFYPDDSSGDAFLFTQSLAEYLKKQKVKFVYGAEVKFSSNNKSEVLLEYQKQLLNFDAIILAAGPWSNDLLVPLNIKLPIEPIKGYSITLNCPDWQNKPSIPIVDHAYYSAITPFEDRLRITGITEFAGLDLNIEPLQITSLKERLLLTYPDLKPQIDKANVSSWTGLRPTSVDGMPYISKTKYSNLWVNTGHGHSGFTLALGSGKYMAQLILKNELAHLNKFSIDR